MDLYPRMDCVTCPSYVSCGPCNAHKPYMMEFEVAGLVQGVAFRKCTQNKATELGVTGWCRNTSRGTVIGKAEGTAKQLRNFRYWLMTVGSPYSVVDRATFTGCEAIDRYRYNRFAIRR